MMRARTGRNIGAVLLIAALAACAGNAGVAREYVAPEAAGHAGMKVAVLPFDNLSAYPDAGLIVSELLTTELYARHSFRLMEQSELRRALAQRKLDASDLGRTTVAAELAAALGVDAVLVGSVSEYGYQHGLREEPTVGVNARLVSAGDGRVLWAASDSGSGRGYLSRESLNATAQRVAMRLADQIRGAFGARGAAH